MKPKGTNDKTNQNTIQNNIQSEDVNHTSEEANKNSNLSNVPVNPSPTGAYVDDSVIQSDLKNIRQSAVKMSVGQKHGASQIVKDWLDDGGEAQEDNVDNKKDETEE